MADRCVAPPRLRCGLVSAQGRERLRSREGSAGRLLGHGDVKMFRWLIVVGLVFFGTGCQRARTVPTAPNVPTYPGKPLAEWVALAKSSDPLSRRWAIGVLGTIGPAAVPALTKGVNGLGFSGSDDGGQRVGRNRSGGAQAPSPRCIKQLLAEREPDVREAVVEALGKMGPAAVAPLAELLNAQAASVRNAPFESLAKIGPAAVPPLVLAPGRHQGSSQCGLGLERNRAGGDGRLPRPGQIAQGRGCERSVLGP